MLPPEPQPQPQSEPQPETQQEQEAPTQPKIEDVQNRPCPNCTVGVLIVTVFDPDALHELDNGVPPEYSTGGAWQGHCFHCNYHGSYPLNPGPKYGDPLPGTKVAA